MEEDKLTDAQLQLLWLKEQQDQMLFEEPGMIEELPEDYELIESGSQVSK